MCNQPPPCHLRLTVQGASNTLHYHSPRKSGHPGISCLSPRHRRSLSCSDPKRESPFIQTLTVLLSRHIPNPATCHRLHWCHFGFTPASPHMLQCLPLWFLCFSVSSRPHQHVRSCHSPVALTPNYLQHLWAPEPRLLPDIISYFPHGPSASPKPAPWVSLRCRVRFHLLADILLGTLFSNTPWLCGGLHGIAVLLGRSSLVTLPKTALLSPTVISFCHNNHYWPICLQ